MGYKLANSMCIKMPLYQLPFFSRILFYSSFCLVQYLLWVIFLIIFTIRVYRLIIQFIAFVFLAKVCTSFTKYLRFIIICYRCLIGYFPKQQWMSRFYKSFVHSLIFSTLSIVVADNLLTTSLIL